MIVDDDYVVMKNKIRVKWEGEYWRRISWKEKIECRWMKLIKSENKNEKGREQED